VCPQSGELALGSLPALNGVPGPVQVTVLPSPIDQDTDVGLATAVTDTPGTDAVAEIGAHPLETHSHVGKFTNWSPAGLAAIVGAGSRNCLRAICANSAGEGNNAASGCCPSGIHTGGRYSASATPSPVHLQMYQAPG
jgi:hypothetical protein